MKSRTKTSSNCVQATEIGQKQLAKAAQVYETVTIKPTLNLTQNHNLIQKKRPFPPPKILAMIYNTV